MHAYMYLYTCVCVCDLWLCQVCFSVGQYTSIVRYVGIVPYSGKISRAKIFEVDLLQNSSRIKFRGSTRLSLHLYAIIRFSRINFQGSSEIHENSEIYCPRKFPAIRYYSVAPVLI